MLRTVLVGLWRWLCEWQAANAIAVALQASIVRGGVARVVCASGGGANVVYARVGVAND